MMVMAGLSAAKAPEIFLRPIRASVVEAVSLLMIDPLHFKRAVQIVPRGRFVGVDDSSLGDARLDESLRLAFRRVRDGNCERAGAGDVLRDILVGMPSGFGAEWSELGGALTVFVREPVIEPPHFKIHPFGQIPRCEVSTFNDAKGINRINKHAT